MAAFRPSRVESLTVCSAKPQILRLGHPCDLIGPNPLTENPQIIAYGRPLVTLCSTYALQETNSPKAGAMHGGRAVCRSLSVVWMRLRGYGIRVLFSFLVGLFVFSTLELLCLFQ